MEIGELVSVAPPAPPPPPDTEFAAELVSATFKSGVKTSHAQAEVTPPYWEAGKEAAIEDDWTDMAKKLGLPAAPYSKRAAVYLVKEINVGDEFQVSITLGKHTPPDYVITDFDEALQHKLELFTSTPLTATYRAKTPGQTRIDIPVMDRKTLLSPLRSVTVNILPAR
jgi:hypothetical protein